MERLCIDCKFYHKVVYDDEVGREMCDHPRIQTLTKNPINGASDWIFISCKSARGLSGSAPYCNEVYGFCGRRGEFFQPKEPEVPKWEVFRYKGWQWWWGKQ
jgi:hypothetical protein